MVVNKLFIFDVYYAVAVDVAYIKRIFGKLICRVVHVIINESLVFDIYYTVAVDVAFQMNLYVQFNVAAFHRNLVLTSDMVLLHHLHGVGAGGNAFDGICGGVALDENLIVCLGVALGNQLKNDVIGIAAKAGGRAGNGIGYNRDVLPNCGYGSVSSNGNLVANCLFAAANAPSLELLAGRSSKAVCRERVFAETPVAAAILPVPPFASKLTV